MGPLISGYGGTGQVLYKHPWIEEFGHTWTRDEDGNHCDSYYRYPESPAYGFFVRTSAEVYVVGPVRFAAEGPERSGTAEIVRDIDAVNKIIDGMYMHGEGMEKVHDLEELAVLPF